MRRAAFLPSNRGDVVDDARRIHEYMYACIYVSPVFDDASVRGGRDGMGWERNLTYVYHRVSPFKTLSGDRFDLDAFATREIPCTAAVYMYIFMPVARARVFSLLWVRVELN